MPVYAIPQDSGPFVVVRGSDGGFAVADASVAGAGKNAAKLGFVFIPCRDEAQAEAVCDTLNAGGHGGSVQVDLFTMPETEAEG